MSSHVVSTLVAMALVCVAGHAQSRKQAKQPTTTVPFVGCVSEGMSGHIDAPAREPVRLRVDKTLGSRLAYYSVEPDLSTLAPRGWHCINIYGSNGADVIITPQPMDAKAAVKAFQNRGLDSPAVILTFSNGFSSGRDEVSSVVSRVFPAHRRIVIDAAADDEMKPQFPGPFPADRLHYLSRESLEFVTPAGQEGLGTLLAPLVPAAQPIEGVQVLVRDRGDCCDLVSLSVRLAPHDADLVPIIMREVQHESKKDR